MIIFFKQMVMEGVSHFPEKKRYKSKVQRY